MNKKVKSLLIVFPSGILLAGLVVLFYLLDPDFEPDAYRVASLVIASIIAFFIIPTVLIAIKWIKKFCEKINFEQGVRSGLHIGLLLGAGGIIILCLLAAPVVGTIWFIQTIKEISSVIKEKRKNGECAAGKPDIFDI